MAAQQDRVNPWDSLVGNADGNVINTIADIYGLPQELNYDLPPTLPDGITISKPEYDPMKFALNELDNDLGNAVMNFPPSEIYNGVPEEYVKRDIIFRDYEISIEITGDLVINDEINRILRNFTTVKFTEFTGIIANLPENILHIKIEGDQYLHSLDNLSLYLLTLEFNILQDEYTHPLDNLPPYLKHLYIHASLEHPLRIIPHSLMSLILVDYEHDVDFETGGNLKSMAVQISNLSQIKSLDQGLLSLGISVVYYDDTDDEDNSEVATLPILLPPNLKFLGVYEIDFPHQMFPVLPDSIETFELDIDNGVRTNTITLPRQLKTLYFDKFASPDLELISGLEHLEGITVGINVLTTLNIERLPPKLRMVNIHSALFQENGELHFNDELMWNIVTTIPKFAMYRQFIEQLIDLPTNKRKYDELVAQPAPALALYYFNDLNFRGDVMNAYMNYISWKKAKNTGKYEGAILWDMNIRTDIPHGTNSQEHGVRFMVEFLFKNRMSSFGERDVNEIFDNLENIETNATYNYCDVFATNDEPPAPAPPAAAPQPVGDAAAAAEMERTRLEFIEVIKRNMVLDYYAYIIGILYDKGVIIGFAP